MEEARRGAEELQRCLEEVRREAEEQGLMLVASWTDKKGAMQSVQLCGDDKVYVTVRQ